MNEFGFVLIGYVAGAASCLVGATLYIILKYHWQRRKDKLKTDKLNSDLKRGVLQRE